MPRPGEGAAEVDQAGAAVNTIALLLPAIIVVVLVVPFIPKVFR